MAEHHPCLIQHDHGGLPFKRHFNAPEEVQEHRQGILVPKVNQFLDLEQGEIGLGEPIFFRIIYLVGVLTYTLSGYKLKPSV